MQIINGTNLPRAKLENQTAIRRIIYHYGPILRSEIVTRLSLTLPTITTTVNNLIAQGYVRELENTLTSEKKLGRKPSLIDIVADRNYFLGIEMRSSLRNLCIVDYRGKILCSVSNQDSCDDFKANMKQTAHMAANLIKDSGLSKSRLAGIGFCLPGATNSRQKSFRKGSQPVWEDNRIQNYLSEFLSYNGPITIVNNGIARAYGALLFHKDLLKKSSSFAYVFISSGISCPLMDTSIHYHGKIWGEGEAGHMVLNPNGPLCYCGNHGCFDVLSGEYSVIQKCTEAIQNDQAPVLRQLCANPGQPKILEILLAQEKGDETVCRILQDAVFYIGIAISNIENFVHPQTILIECRFFENKQNYDKLLEVIHNSLYTSNNVDIHLLSPDEFSGAKGAAAVAIDNNLDLYIE